MVRRRATIVVSWHQALIGDGRAKEKPGRKGRVRVRFPGVTRRVGLGSLFLLGFLIVGLGATARAFVEIDLDQADGFRL
jgi:hypothetical protein